MDKNIKNMSRDELIKSLTTKLKIEKDNLFEILKSELDDIKHSSYKDLIYEISFLADRNNFTDKIDIEELKSKNKDELELYLKIILNTRFAFVMNIYNKIITQNYLNVKYPNGNYIISNKTLKRFLIKTNLLDSLSGYSYLGNYFLDDQENLEFNFLTITEQIMLDTEIEKK